MHYRRGHDRPLRHTSPAPHFRLDSVFPPFHAMTQELSPNRRRKLPVGKMLIGAFLLPWWSRRAFARALVLPALAVLALKAAWLLADDALPAFARWLFIPLYGVLFTVFAVRCHRLVLLGPDDGAPRSGFDWSLRETRFFLRAAVLYVAAAIVYAAIVPLLSVLLNVMPRLEWPDAFRYTPFVAWFAGTYVFARLCLVLPATALDRALPLGEAWRRSRGNGLRLMLVVAGLPWLLGWLVDFAYRRDATELEWLLVVALGIVASVFEVAAVSLCYRELAAAGDAPPMRGSQFALIRDDLAFFRPRSKRAWSVAAIAALVSGSYLALMLSAQQTDCRRTTVSRERSPNGEREARLERRSCETPYARTVEIWLGDGRTSTLVYQAPATVMLDGRPQRVEPRFVWLDDRRLEVGVPDILRDAETRAEQVRAWTAREYAGVAVSYREIPQREDSPQRAGK